MTSGRLSTAARHPLGVVLALMCVLAAVWILGTVPSGGPDEPVHIVRGASLVRGQLDGQSFPGEGRLFELPAWIGYPDHGCFSLRPEQPANCATAAPAPDGEAFLVSTALEYPIWGHLAPGLGTLFPSAIGNQMARVFDAAIPIALIGAALALAARRSRLAVASIALAVTPMAWFSIVVVNPSGLVISGGIALWTALLVWPPGRGDVDRLTRWTAAAGWAAMVLPRRDGMIWAVCIVGVVALVGRTDVVGLLRRLGRVPLLVVVASTLATMAWALSTATTSSKLLLGAPLVPVAAAAVNAAWRRAGTSGARASMAGLAALGVVAAGAVAVTRRRGGFDAELIEKIIGESGSNLEEAVGVLGWLDTPIPRIALFGWLVALGVLGGIVLAERTISDVAVAVGVVVFGILASWGLEISQGTTSGTYYQGRYFLPLLVGVPLLLGFSRLVSEPGSDDSHPDPDSGVAGLERTNRVATQASVVVGVAMFVLSMAFAASMRRWGVGTGGSMLPWDWDTYGTRLPPWSLLVVHVLIGVELTRRVRVVDHEPEPAAEAAAMATIAADDR